jgi:hypothetical protein
MGTVEFQNAGTGKKRQSPRGGRPVAIPSRSSLHKDAHDIGFYFGYRLSAEARGRVPSSRDESTTSSRISLTQFAIRYGKAKSMYPAQEKY